MSDIVIRDMEMPKCCFKGVFEHCEHYYNCEVFRKNCNEKFIVEYSNKRHHDCPLVELPEHDKLVDIREVRDKMIKYGFTAPDMTVTEFVEDELTAVLEASEVKA